MRLALLLLLLIACTDKSTTTATITADPAELPLSGYTPVTLDLSASGLSPDEITAATVAGIPAYDLTPDGDTLTLTVQGAPDAGPVDLVLTDADGDHTFSDALTYTAPLDPAFDHIIAFGASLGMGVQSIIPTIHGQLHDPPADLARQLGAWLPLPLLKDGLFTGVQPSDIGPPPDCTLPDVFAIAEASASTALSQLRDPDTGDFGFQYGRIDADLPNGNLSVAGSGVSDVVDGPGDFGEVFLSHLIFDPYAGISDPITTPQLDLVEAAAPTLILSVDVEGNDLIDMVTEDVLDPTLATPRDAFLAETDTMMSRLAATGAEVFLANTPDMNVLPYGQQVAARMIANGTSADDVAALQAQIRAVVVDYNEIFAEAAAPYPNLHIVDVFTPTDALVADGLVVGDQTLTTHLLGGLMSLDGVHFSDTGYAVLANLFITAINDALGTDVPAIDLEATLADDPFSPDALTALGLAPGSCTD